MKDERENQAENEEHENEELERPLSKEARSRLARFYRLLDRWDREARRDEDGDED